MSTDCVSNMYLRVVSTASDGECEGEANDKSDDEISTRSRTVIGGSPTGGYPTGWRKRRITKFSCWRQSWVVAAGNVLTPGQRRPGSGGGGI
jgi:hypothetical protein